MKTHSIIYTLDHLDCFLWETLMEYPEDWCEVDNNILLTPETAEGFIESFLENQDDWTLSTMTLLNNMPPFPEGWGMLKVKDKTVKIFHKNELFEARKK